MVKFLKFIVIILFFYFATLSATHLHLHENMDFDNQCKICKLTSNKLFLDTSLSIIKETNTIFEKYSFILKLNFSKITHWQNQIRAPPTHIFS